MQSAQLSTPVLIGRTHEKGALWWFRNRYYWDTEGLSQADVLALLVQGEQRKQATIERAHAGAFGGSVTSGGVSDATQRRLLKEEERERKQRLIEERAADIEGRNASLEATITRLENRLVETLDRDVAAPGGFDDGDPEAIATYFSGVLDASFHPEGFPKEHRVAFVPESRQLVVELELPTLTVVPPVKTYRYVASRNAIDETARPLAQSKALYVVVRVR